MSVYIPNTNPEWTRYLFAMWNYKLYLNSIGKIVLKNGSSAYTSVDYNWNFQTIRAEKQGNNYTLKVWWSTSSFTSSNSIPDNYIYIWSEESTSPTKQINSVIDYVKIYK